MGGGAIAAITNFVLDFPLNQLSWLQIEQIRLNELIRSDVTFLFLQFLKQEYSWEAKEAGDSNAKASSFWWRIKSICKESKHAQKKVLGRRR